MLMKTFIATILIACLETLGTGYAQDVYVEGFYRSNGTYVESHYRSAPDSSKANNYGPRNSTSSLSISEFYSNNQFELRNRDSDSDGIANYIDQDDNNNGIHDNFDANQYGISGN